MSAGEKNGRPPAPAVLGGKEDAPGRPESGLAGIERDLERLAVPHRSLFEPEDDAAPSALSGAHRANPLSVLVEAVKAASGFVVLVGLGLVGDFLGGDLLALAKLVAAAAAILGVCLLFCFLAWRSRTWELTGAGLVVCWGLGWGPFARRSLTVPYEHIHTVTMRSELLERVFGLMTLDLDTGAAASEGDASRLRGLRAGEAEALRAELFRRKRVAEAGEAGVDPATVAGAVCARDEDPLATYALTTRELVLACASRMSVASQAFALVIMLAQGVNQLIEWRVLDLAGTGDEIVATPLGDVVPVVAWFVVAVLVLGAVVSFALNLVRYAGYRVERYEDRVVVEHGLLSRSSSTLATERVQHVVLRQGVIRQVMGFAEVQAQVVSGPGEEGGEPMGTVVLHPFLRTDELDAFLAEVLPRYAGVLGRVELGRLGPVARRRAVLRAVIWWPFSAGLAAAGLWLAGVSGLAARAAWIVGPLVAAAAVLSLALLVARVLDALRGWGAARYGHTARELVLVSGGLTRLTVIALRGRLQRVELRANPFQRRAGVATVSVRTAAERADGLGLRDVPAAAADELLAWVRPRG